MSLDAVEDLCESMRTTLVVHPVIRGAVKGYEESFYIGLRCFSGEETDGLYFLPLPSGDYVRLLFSKRRSPQGYDILRVDALSREALQRIKRASGLSRGPLER